MLNVLATIQNDNENIINDQPQLFPIAASDGDYYRQGDIYIVKRDALPTGALRDEKTTLQLAPGTTKGKTSQWEYCR